MHTNAKSCLFCTTGNVSFLCEKFDRLCAANADHTQPSGLGNGMSQAASSYIGHGSADNGIAQAPGCSEICMKHDTLPSFRGDKKESMSFSIEDMWEKCNVTG